jgi:hypothetical protein
MAKKTYGQPTPRTMGPREPKVAPVKKDAPVSEFVRSMTEKLGQKIGHAYHVVDSTLTAQSKSSPMRTGRYDIAPSHIKIKK